MTDLEADVNRGRRTKVSSSALTEKPDHIIDLLGEFTGGKVARFEAGLPHGYVEYTVKVPNSAPQPEFAEAGIVASPFDGGYGKDETGYMVNAQQDGFAEKLAAVVAKKRASEMKSSDNQEADVATSVSMPALASVLEGRIQTAINENQGKKTLGWAPG